MRMFQQHAKDLYNRTRWNVSVIDDRPTRSNQLILTNILELWDKRMRGEIQVVNSRV